MKWVFSGGVLNIYENDMTKREKKIKWKKKKLKKH